MEPSFADWQRQPRPLTYRQHYRWYAFALAAAWPLCAGLCAYLGWSGFEYWREEVLCLAALSVLYPVLYFVWLHPKLTQSIQVFSDSVKICSPKMSFEIKYVELQAVERPWGSNIVLKTKDGLKWRFNASVERLDYLWEALWKTRPELVGNSKIYEEFRLTLVQCDHHEKRKEWFFRHRMLDVLNWIVFPVWAMIVGYWWQSQDVVIHAKGLYFFRLGMFMLLASICSAFVFSAFFRRFVFDKALEDSLDSDRSKRRDISHEDQIIRRAKGLQFVTCFGLAVAIIWSGLNLYSVTRVKDGAQAFRLVPGKTHVVDNRFNCVRCAYSVKEGDIMVFGKGVIGQVLGLPGDVIARTTPGQLGRSVASETVTVVPAGQVAVRTGPEGREISFVKIEELVGKLKNQ